MGLVVRHRSRRRASIRPIFWRLSGAVAPGERAGRRARRCWGEQMPPQAFRTCRRPRPTINAVRIGREAFLKAQQYLQGIRWRREPGIRSPHAAARKRAPRQTGGDNAAAALMVTARSRGGGPDDRAHVVLNVVLRTCPSESQSWRVQYFASARRRTRGYRRKTRTHGRWNPRRRWVYGRIAIAQSQGWTRGRWHGPPSFSPVFREAHPRQFDGHGPGGANYPDTGGLLPATHGGTRSGCSSHGRARGLGRCGVHGEAQWWWRHRPSGG